MEFDKSKYNKEQRVNRWKTAIGLQAVDGLQPSNYLYELAGKHIEGELNIQEVKSFLKSYYEDKNNRNVSHDSNEADKVSANIMSLLEDNHFMLCADEYRSIHESLFYDVFPHAGIYRVRNISKREWILQRDSVEYGDYHSIVPELEKAMDEEAGFNYSRLDNKEKIRHFAKFIAKIWQIHPFFEGNTRTTALFAIKYLRSVGKDIDNEIFRNHSFYFRNALVRACYSNSRMGITRDYDFLNKFFYNLLEGEKHELQNRNMLILPPDGWIKDMKNDSSVNKDNEVHNKKMDNIEIYKHNGDIHCIKCSLDNVEQKGKHLRFDDLMKWYKIKDTATPENKAKFLNELANKYFEKELVQSEYSNIRIYPDRANTKMFLKANKNGVELSAVEISKADERLYARALQRNVMAEVDNIKMQLAEKYYSGLKMDENNSKGLKL